LFSRDWRDFSHSVRLNTEVAAQQKLPTAIPSTAEEDKLFSSKSSYHFQM
jgi:hypothetical protein